MSTGVVSGILDVVGIVAPFIPGIGWALKAGIVVASALGSAYLKRQNLAARQEGIQQNVTSNQVALPVVYGRTRIGGAIVDVRVDESSENNERLGVVLAFCLASENGAGIEDIESIEFDGRPAIINPPIVTDPRHAGLEPQWFHDGDAKVLFTLHDGDDAQVVDTELDSTFGAWTSASPGKGICYGAFWFTYHEEVFPTGRPNVTAVIRGQKVYDPRSDAWAWSDNPALCILDYLTSKRYGLGAAYAARDGGTRDEIDEASFIAAANHCDETVSAPSGSEKRYTCNGWVATGQSLNRNLQELLSSCRGQLVYQGGKFRLVINQPDTATSFELTEDNIVGDWRFFRAGTQGAPNGVTATFLDSAANWQPNDVTWPEAGQTNGFLTNDQGFENRISVDLPFTDGWYRAQRLGMLAVREAREDIGASVTATEAALVLQVGDVVPVSHSTPGWSQKSMRVRAIAPQPDGLVRLVLTEYDVGAYSIDAQNTRDTLPGTTLPDPYSVEPPTNVVVQSNDDTAQGLVPRLLVTWTRSVDTFLNHYEVEYRVAGGTPEENDWIPAAKPHRESVALYIGPVQDRELYDVRIRAVNRIFAKSDWVLVEDVRATLEPRAFFRLDEDEGELFLVWDAVNPFGVEQARWIVDETDQPTLGEVQGSASTDSTGRVKVHDFDPAGADSQRVWVGVIAESPDGGAGRDQGALEVLSWTYRKSNDRPVLAVEYVGRGSEGREKWIASVTDDGDQVRLYIRTYDKGTTPPAYTAIPSSSTYQADPLLHLFDFVHPRDEDPAVVIEAYAVDDAGNESKAYYAESDADTLPSGSVSLTVDGENEVLATPRTVDTDAKSYRFRAVVAAEGSDGFTDPAFSDAAGDEWSGTAFGSQVKLSTILSGIDALRDGEELFLSGFVFNTAATSASAQNAASRSAVIRKSIAYGFVRNALRGVSGEYRPTQTGTNVWFHPVVKYQLVTGAVASIEYRVYRTDTDVDLATGSFDVTGDGSFLFSSVNQHGYSQVPMAVTLTPYDATGGSGGSGQAGTAVTVDLGTPLDSGDGVKVLDENTPSTVRAGDILVAGAGVLADEDDDGRPRVALHLSTGTAAPGTLAIGELYGRHD